ncbi:MAG: methionyl-tRNA formyltransferase [Pseudomonadota bacterium]
MSAPARIGFAGSPPFAAIILEALLAADHRPIVVYSQPARPKGRGRKPVPSAVAGVAEREGLTLETPRSLKSDEAQKTLASYDLDLLVVVAYGLILPPAILDTPRYGGLNVHASLLPRWRGAAPIERAILAGDTETGVALMRMEAGLDTGPVYCTVKTPITERTTGGSLEDTLAKLGAAALVDLLPTLTEQTPEPQGAEGVSYAHKLTPSDSWVDWSQPAVTLDRQIRALIPRQPATTALGDLRVRILDAELEDASVHSANPGTLLELAPEGLRVATGAGVLRLTQVTLNRGKGTPLDASALRNGYRDRFPRGAVFDPAPPIADS